MVKAIVGISCNYKAEEWPHHLMGDKYVRAVIEAAGCVPLLIPAVGEDLDVDALLAGLDGVLLTGGRSNVEPHHYDGPPPRDATLLDPMRDGVSLPLVRRAAELMVPIFGICRGIQEINVAFGGSLHQHLHEVDGRFDHRMERELPIIERFRPRKRIRISPGGYLAKLNGGEEAVVNSLHSQGIDRLGHGLTVEATAEDDTVEAVTVTGAETFALGVQWHPEYQPLEHPLYAAMFGAFGDAARQRAEVRLNGGADAAPVKIAGNHLS